MTDNQEQVYNAVMSALNAQSKALESTEEVQDITQRVEVLEEKIEADRGQFPVKDKCIDSLGREVAMTGYRHTGLVVIDRTADITVTGTGVVSIAILTLFDASGKVVSIKAFSVPNKQETYTIPAAEIPVSAAYFAACGHSAHYGTWSNGRASLVPLANAAKAAEKAVLIKRWNTVFKSKVSTDGRHNPQTGYFEAFEITDITDEQALLILEEGILKPPSYHSFAYSNVRVIYALRNFYTMWDIVEIPYLLYNCDVEVLALTIPNGTVKLTNARYMVQQCTKLKKIVGIMDIGGVSQGTGDTMFSTAEAPLEEMQLKNLKISFNLKGAKALSLASLQYLVDNSAVPEGSNAAVLLHADVYAKLTDELIASAAEKRITFASAS